MKNQNHFILSQCDNSSDMKMWDWKDPHMDWTLSCLDYVISIPEVNPIPRRFTKRGVEKQNKTLKGNQTKLVAGKQKYEWINMSGNTSV